MRVAVEDDAHAIAIDRLLEAARAEIRENLRRLAFDRSPNRRVMHQRDALAGAKPRERRFELERLVYRFLDELLDGALAPRPQRSAPEAAGKSLHHGEADPLDLGRFPVEDRHPDVSQYLPDLL